MAKAGKCDVCGKLYEIYNYKHDANKTNAIMFVNVDLDDRHFTNPRKELCPDCMSSIRRHIDNISKGLID